MDSSGVVSVNLSPEINISPDEALPPIDTENEASTDGAFFIVATALRSTSAADGVAEVLARHTVVVSMVKMMRSLVYSFIIMDNKKSGEPGLCGNLCFTVLFIRANV